MLISGTGSGTTIATEMKAIRSSMDDLQRQLATGKISRDYAGLGGGRDVSLTMRAQLSRTESYGQTVSFVAGRLEAQMLVLDRVQDIATDTAGGAVENNLELTSDGKTVQQTLAGARFEEMLSLLNTEYEDRHLFSGRRTDTPAHIGYDAIMNGDGTDQGLNQLTAQAKDQWMATDRKGHTETAIAGTAVSIARTGGAPAGYGFAAIGTSDTAGAYPDVIDTSTAGTIDFTGNPTSGQTVTVTMVDQKTNETHTITLTAFAPGGPDVGSEESRFEIGASAAATAANFKAVLDAKVTEATTGRFEADAAFEAADAFFGKSPIPAYATGSFVEWYSGDDNGTGTQRRIATGVEARGTAVAKVDDNMKVNYGVQANESAFVETLAALAVFAGENFTTDTPSERARYSDMSDKVRDRLSEENTGNRTRGIQTELGAVQVQVEEARIRHRFRDQLALDMIDRVEAADDNDVATRLLRAQTQLQMTFQTTAMISRLSLANIL